MGASVSGIIIKCNPNDFKLDEIVDYFFCGGSEIDSCDTRENDCLYLSKLQNEVFISNADFAQLFFSRNKKVLEKINEFFKNPLFAFAFNWFESGGTFGYSIIENGQYIRAFRSIEYEKVETYGSPIELEKPWLGGNSYSKRVDPHPEQFVSNDYNYYPNFHVNLENGIEYHEAGLPEILVSKLMVDFFKFDVWSMNDFESKRKSFKLNPWINKVYNETAWS